MRNIVFTGAATDRSGNPIIRDELKLAAMLKGFTVQSSVTLQTEMLVASRNDTRKAMSAIERG